MNTDPSASRPQRDLVAIAANPNTDLEVLRTLAYEYPHLRPVIALNPSAYEGLLQWLGDLGDEDVNAALRQRAESGPVFPSDEGEAGNADADGAEAGSGSDEADAGADDADGADSSDADGESDTDDGGGDETEVLSPVAGMPAVQQPANGANRDEKVAAVPGASAAAGATNDVESDDKNRSTKKTILILAAVAIVLVALVIYFATRSPATDADLAETEAPTEAATESTEAPTEPEETTEEPTEPELKYPAPDGTSTIERVAAPSGNIVCQLSEDAVTCTVFETNDGEAFGDRCEDGTVTVQATADGVALKCDSPVAAEGMASVDYGNFGQFGNVACGSQFNGVSCWNQETGQGFGVSRQGWAATDEGFIAEDSYPWFE